MEEVGDGLEDGGKGVEGHDEDDEPKFRHSLSN